MASDYAGENMKPSRRSNLLTAAWLLAIMACASSSDRSLAKRGLPAEERHGFIIQHGYQVPLEIRQAFERGQVVSGMDKEFVFQLYGRPDRTSGKALAWEYLDKQGRLVTGLTFRDDKVDSIYGDAGGGTRP